MNETRHTEHLLQNIGKFDAIRNPADSHFIQMIPRSFFVFCYNGNMIQPNVISKHDIINVMTGAFPSGDKVMSSRRSAFSPLLNIQTVFQYVSQLLAYSPSTYARRM